MLNSLLSHIIAFFTGMVNNLNFLFRCGEWPDFSQIFWVGVILIVWFASAFWAATVAEMSFRPMGKHFFLGLLLPYFYPVYLMRYAVSHANDIQEKQEQANEVAHNEASDRFEHVRAKRLAKKQGVDITAVEPLKPRVDASIPVEAPDETPKSPYNRLYFASLSSTQSGPWLLQLGTGNPLLVAEIKDAGEEFMSVSVNGKTLRIRYENIVHFEEQSS